MENARYHASGLGGPKLKKTCILVVDDNPTTLHMLASLLDQAGYETARATNGLEALEALRRAPEVFDVVLLDRMMPVMDGMELIRHIHADSELRFIPIVMQTAADRPEEISEGIKAGVFYYLTKPLERKTLLSVIHAAAKQMEQQRLLRNEMRRHRLSFGLIQVMKSTFRTTDEAESLASFLANCFPDPERALNGISELLINAVEHGNLGISYEEKTRLMDENRWREEIDRRLQSPPFAQKKVVVIFERKEKTWYLQVTDEGAGFDWKNYLEFDPSRASHNHGRGIAMANTISFDKLIYNKQGNQVTAVMQRQESSGGDPYWG